MHPLRQLRPLRQLLLRQLPLLAPKLLQRHLRLQALLLGHQLQPLEPLLRAAQQVRRLNLPRNLRQPLVLLQRKLLSSPLHQQQRRLSMRQVTARLALRPLRLLLLQRLLLSLRLPPLLQQLKSKSK